MTVVAVLGLGAMGLPMATNLAKSFSVNGYDISEDRLKLAEESGVNTFNTSRSAVKEAQVVLLAVRNASQLEQSLFGDEGIVPCLHPGASIILTSTVGVSEVEEVARRLAEKSLGLVDAPVSGGPVRAGDGELLVTVGATAEEWKKTQPVLQAMASNLVLVGSVPGKGQAMKTVNQLLCGVHIAAAGEALALADALGLDPAAALEALMSGAAASFMLGDRGPRALQAYETPGPEVKSRLDIFVKDMGIVTDAAKQVGLPVPLAAAAQQEYLMGNANGQGAEDDSTVIRVVAPSPRQAR